MSGFPAGTATDIRLLTYRGLGRGKGFEIIESTSGLDDRALCEALKSKVVPLVRVLIDQGIIDARELAVPNPTPDNGPSYSEFVAWINEGEERRDAVLVPPEHDDRKEREQREQIQALAKAVRVTREKLHHATVRVNSLERRLGRCSETTERLVAASRGCVASLHDLHGRVQGHEGRQAIAPVAHEVRRIAELVRELRKETALPDDSHSAGTAR